MHCSVKARCVEHRHAKTAVHVLRLEGRERANVWGVLQETVVRKVSFYTSRLCHTYILRCGCARHGPSKMIPAVLASMLEEFKLTFVITTLLQQ